MVAGGAGTRLWPVSTPEYPKHLLKINSNNRSLLQQTYDRAKGLSKKIYVISEASHVIHVREQLPNLPDDHFIVEPARRGTANCIALALAHISNYEDKDEPLVFLAADHFVRDVDGFTHSFKIAAEVSKNKKRIVLVGAEPNYPATGFGYIEKGKVLNEKYFVFNVKSFKEKPPFEVAKKYLKEGRFLWNCSYFVGSINVFETSMAKYAPGLFHNLKLLKQAQPDKYDEVYLGLKNDTIDYALIEKVPDLLVVPASFDWIDVGSFSDWYKVVEPDNDGNHITGEMVETLEIENSFIQNHCNKPLAVIGLDNVVVVNTKDGTLVVRKDLAQQVGDVSKRFYQEV